MKVIGIILISIFILSCNDDPVVPEEFVNTISYRIINIVNDDTYYVNDDDTGIDNIVIQKYTFFTDSNQLFYRNPGPNIEKLNNYYTTGIIHHSEFPNWNKLQFEKLIVNSENFSKIEFSLDRMDDEEVKEYKDSSRYDLLRTSDRYSLFVSGYYRKNGILKNFSLYSKYEGRIGAIFDDKTRLWYNTKRNITVEMSAESFFTVDGKVIEPLQSNMPILEKNFVKCLKAIAN
jgi:hypothetical protein